MTTPPLPRLTPAERRTAIETAATRLFAERGFAHTTLDDIAAAAGVGKPMLYRHFESKQDLGIALLQTHRDALVAAPLSRFSPVADPGAQLGAMLDAWLAHIEQHPHATRFLFTPMMGDSRVATAQAELHQRQRDTQLALIKEFAPALDPVEAEALAHAMWASLASVALWWLDHPDVPREVPVRALLRLAIGALSAHLEAEGVE